jgi:hypothetical protein
VMQALSFILLTIACILHVFISFQKWSTIWTYPKKPENEERVV